jgi:hypothetical protein
MGQKLRMINLVQYMEKINMNMLINGLMRSLLMNHHVQYFVRRRTITHFFRNLIFCSVLFMPLTATATESVADEIISIDVEEQPLGKILAEISEETGYQFDIHESWQDFPITASFGEEPLHKALKKILRTLNNAIIYGSDGVIKILIYGEISSSVATARLPISERTYEEPIRQHSPLRQPSIPQLGVRVSELGRDDQIDEPSTEESESVTESVDTSDDEEEQKEDAEKSEEEERETSESQENENASGKDVDDTEETSEESDDSEGKEDAEETTTN